MSDAEYPASREYPYLKEFQDTIDQARSNPVDILVDGDSLTLYFKGQTAWQQHLAPCNAVDFGNGHDAVENLLWRIKNGELEGLHPKLIVLEIGQGNLGRNSPEEIAGGIQDALAIYRAQCPDAHILLFGIFPRDGPGDALRAACKQTNALLAKLDDGQHITYLDIGDKFLLPDGTHNPDLAPARDFEAMTTKGYETWTEAIQPFIDKYCPKTSLSTAPSAPGDTKNEPVLNYPFPDPPNGMPNSRWPQPPMDGSRSFAHTVDAVAGQPCGMIFDGDSITYGWAHGGADVWNARYGAFHPIDFGVPSDVVQNALWRVQHGQLDGKDPKFVELLIGTNNHGQDPKGVAAGIRLLVNEYKARCPHAHILLLGIFAADPKPGTPQRLWFPQVNQILSTFGDDRVTYLDIGPKFLQPDGTLTADIMPDFLHPSAKGYAIWADAIQSVIDQSFPAAAAK